jgi:hypothetical protein
MPLPTVDPAPSLDAMRARFRAFGLKERVAGTSFFYLMPDADARILLVLQPFGAGAQIYLYPEALRRPAGAVQWFYARLEGEGFGMGSKLGPSISLPVDRPALMDVFWTGFEQLFKYGERESR